LPSAKELISASQIIHISFIEYRHLGFLKPDNSFQEVRYKSSKKIRSPAVGKKATISRTYSASVLRSSNIKEYAV